MSLNSPGQGSAGWSASLAAHELQLEAFLNNGLRKVPVALVPANGGSISLKSAKFIEGELKSVSAHFLDVEEVRPYGKSGVLCLSANLDCVADLLKCTSFASLPVNAFVPAHLACVRGIVRE